MKPPRILIIAGSDSGGGAGIQADIKTVTMLGGYAMTAITAITAQNTLGVESVMPVSADMVLKQIDMVLGDIGADAVKIGMIGSAATALAVAERLERLENIPIILDPVMVASSGAALADAATIGAFEKLMVAATLVTPNAPELAVLTGHEVTNILDMEAAAHRLAERADIAVLAKGGHLEGSDIVDLLVLPGGAMTRWNSNRIETRHTHGTGCTLASAVATNLGHGLPLVEAVARARLFVRRAMAAAPGFGAGHGPMGHWAAGDEITAMNLNQVTVAANDYSASIAFYRKLGLRQIVDAPPRYARFECPGGATFSVHAADQGPGDTIVYFECPDVDSWVAKLTDAGVAFLSEPEDQPWLWREARLNDPAGNAICLYHAGAARRFPPWRLEEAD